MLSFCQQQNKIFKSLSKPFLLYIRPVCGNHNLKSDDLKFKLLSVEITLLKVNNIFDINFDTLSV